MLTKAFLEIYTEFCKNKSHSKLLHHLANNFENNTALKLANRGTLFSFKINEKGVRPSIGRF